MKSILDPTFRYVKSHDTDIAATFRRVRREEAARIAAAQANASEARAKTVPIKRKEKA